MPWFPKLLKNLVELLSRLRPARPRVVNRVAVLIRHVEVKLAIADPTPPTEPAIPAEKLRAAQEAA